MKYSPCSPEMIARALPPRGDILEIGCGEGALLSFLAQRGTYRLAGCEPDAERAALAARIAGVAVRCARAESLPFPDRSFDAAVLECVFSLCAARQTVLELARTLRPGGVAVVADLFSTAAQGTASDSTMLGRLGPREALEQSFSEKFELVVFQDHTAALRAMFAQMLMDGRLCDCIGAADLPLLRAAKPGYGLWIWKKS